MEFFFQNVINALQWGSFYSLIAVGYSMVYGVLLLFNFAHGDIFMVGAYIGFFVSSGLLALDVFGRLELPTAVSLALVLVLTLIVSMALNSIVGMLVERIGYRPLRDAPRASAAITGLMIGIILETGNLAILGPQRLAFPELIQSATIDIAGVSITNKKILIVGVSLLLTFGLHRVDRR
jgi:branched-chain amino acid transport system permease protein